MERRWRYRFEGGKDRQGGGGIARAPSQRQGVDRGVDIVMGVAIINAINFLRADILFVVRFCKATAKYPAGRITYLLRSTTS